MYKTNGWVSALFALVFIAVPAMIGFYFLLPDWNQSNRVDVWIYYVVSLGFLLYVAFLSTLLIYFKILGIDSLNFNIPISLVFCFIFISYDWHISLRIICAIFAILSALPIMIFTNSYVDKKIAELKKKNKH